jgi:hypothetical protein
MKNLEVNYSISKNLKYLAMASGGCLFAISAGVSISRAIAGSYSFFFYVGVVGMLVALALVLTFWLSQSKPIVVITNEQFQMRFPKYFEGVVEWKDVAQLTIGLSYITITTNENEHLKIDFENLKYVDIRAIKTKLIEICEEKNISYSNG